MSQDWWAETQQKSRQEAALSEGRAAKFIFSLEANFGVFVQ